MTPTDLHLSSGSVPWSTLGAIVETIAVLAAACAWHWLMTLNLRRK